MGSDRSTRRAGLAAVAGGLLALAVTPFMVIVKYSTGWAIVPEPAWVALVRPAVEPLVTFGTPVQLWVFYGLLYSLSLVLMGSGLLGLRSKSVAASRAWSGSLWVLLAGLSLVLAGDAVHTATWHLGGATIPRANLNPVASAGISIEYLGIPMVFASSFVLGLIALRGAMLPPAVSLLLLAVAPGGVLLTVTQLPAMPSGALAILSVAMIVFGCSLAAGPRHTGERGAFAAPEPASGPK